MFRLRQTLVRKSKISSTKGFTSPSKAAKPPVSVKTVVNPKPACTSSNDSDASDFEPGDEHFGAFGDMQEGNAGENVEYDDSAIEEVSLAGGDEDSEYSERTVDEEEYELYMKTANTHKIEDFEEWRNSEHFPQHLFEDSDSEDEDDYDEITVDSVELHESLLDGGMVIDWTGTRITLDTYNQDSKSSNDAKEEKKKKKRKKKKKKTTKIKVKKSKKSKHSGSKSVSSSEKKKKRKSEKRSKLTKTNSFNSSENPKRKSLKENLSKENVKKPSNGEDCSKDSSYVSHGSSSFVSGSSSVPSTGSKTGKSPKRGRRSSKVGLTGGSNHSLLIADLDNPSTPTASPVGARAVKKRSSTRRSPGTRSKSKSTLLEKGDASDDTLSMNSSSFGIPESMREPKSKPTDSSDFSSKSLVQPQGARRASTTGSMVDNTTTTSPGSPRSPRSHNSRASPLGRRGGRKSKPQVWADSMAALSKPELKKSVSAGNDEVIARRSISGRPSTTTSQSPKRRRASVGFEATTGTNSPITRRSISSACGVVTSPIPRRSNSNNASVTPSPISSRSSSHRRIQRNSNYKLPEMDDTTCSHGAVRRKSNTTRRQRNNSAGAMDTKVWRLARDKLGESNHSTSFRQERQKSEKLLSIERMAREGAEQHAAKRSNSLGALEKRKGVHRALREKLALDESDRSMQDKDSEGAKNGKQPLRRPSSFDASKIRRGNKSDDSSVGSASTGLSDEKVAQRRSSSLGTPTSRRRQLRGSKKIVMEAVALDASTDTFSSLEASKNSFDPFGVADDLRNDSSTLADSSDALFDSSTRSSRSVLKKPAKKRDSLATASNHGKGPVALMSPRKSPASRKKVLQKQARRKSNNGLRNSSHHSIENNTGISSKDITW